jgi:hypothetical protein
VRPVQNVKTAPPQLDNGNTHMHANPSVLCSDGKSGKATLRFLHLNTCPAKQFCKIPARQTRNPLPAHLFVHETKRNETNCCASLQAAKTHLGNPASRISHRASPHGSSSRATLNQTWRPACTARNWRRRFGLRQYRAGLVGIACSRCLRGHRNRRRLRGLCSRPCPLNPYLRHH